MRPNKKKCLKCARLTPLLSSTVIRLIVLGDDIWDPKFHKSLYKAPRDLLWESLSQICALDDFERKI